MCPPDQVIPIPPKRSEAILLEYLKCVYTPNTKINYSHHRSHCGVKSHIYRMSLALFKYISSPTHSLSHRHWFIVQLIQTQFTQIYTHTSGENRYSLCGIGYNGRRRSNLIFSQTHTSNIYYTLSDYMVRFAQPIPGHILRSYKYTQSVIAKRMSDISLQQHEDHFQHSHQTHV